MALWAAPSSKLMQSLSAKTLACVFGRASRLRCRDVVAAILHDPTKIEPASAVAMEAFQRARRVLRKREARLALGSAPPEAFGGAYTQCVTAACAALAARVCACHCSSA